MRQDLNVCGKKRAQRIRHSGRNGGRTVWGRRQSDGCSKADVSGREAAARAGEQENRIPVETKGDANVSNGLSGQKKEPEDKEAVADRFVYPKNITVSSGTFEVKGADELLPYYDEIFSETFKQNLDMEAEEELFCHNGMISFGSGLIWFGPVYGEESAAIIAINGADGCRVGYGGAPGVITE